MTGAEGLRCRIYVYSQCSNLVTPCKRGDWNVISSFFERSVLPAIGRALGFGSDI